MSISGSHNVYYGIFRRGAKSTERDDSRKDSHYFCQVPHLSAAKQKDKH